MNAPLRARRVRCSLLEVHESQRRVAVDRTGCHMSHAFALRRDGNVIRGRLHQASGDGGKPFVLLLQGSPGNARDVLGLGQRLAPRGYNVVTFNYSGTHHSGGLSSFEDSQRDIAAVHEWLVDSRELGVDRDRLVLGGWSYGGGMALTYSANHPEIACVFSISGTDHGEFMREYGRDPDYRRMVDDIFAEMARPGSNWRLSPGATPREAHEAGETLAAYDFRELAPHLTDRNLLMVGAWEDHDVKIESHVLPLYRALKRAGAGVFIAAFQDDHSYASVRDELADVIIAWMDERVPQ